MNRRIGLLLSLLLASCAQADDQQTNLDALNAAELDPAVTNYDESGLDATEGEDRADELWIGSVGGDGEQACTKVNSGDIGTTPYIPVQHGEATILSESDESVVLWTKRVDNGEDMKMIFGVSKDLCEAARVRAEREPFPKD